MRILFIGNSFTSRNDLLGMLSRLAEEAKPSQAMETAAVVAGGASLRRHWNGGTALRLLNEAHWDYVVLQEQSTLPIKNVRRFHENVRLFIPEIKEHNAQPILYLTWSRRDKPESQSILNDAVEAVAADTGASVARVGPAWHEAMRELPAVDLYASDGAHPTPAGSYLAASVFFNVIFGRPPDSGRNSAEVGLSAAEADVIHRIAGGRTRAGTG